ncbi:MAG: substrate-binding domain-containing protein, partial [Acidobacteriota bacterium]
RAGKTTQAWVRVTGVLFLAALTGGAWWLQAHRVPATPTIAFIPQAAGPLLWEVEQFGATVAAEKLKYHLYWNAPTSENDVAGQISLIDKVVRGRYQGLVVAPNHPLAILSPLRRALAAGLPVVIVSAPLDLPASGKLGYIVNDDEKMGELAAAEVARLIRGKGLIALAGLARYAPGVKDRVRGAERFLATRFPEIRIVSRVGGAYNTSRAEELTSGVVDSHPGLKAVLSFTASSTRGVHAALKSRSLQGTVRLVGCEQDADLIGYVSNGEIAAVLAENTYRMGYEAVGLIAASLAGKPLPPRSVVPPLLITEQNFTSAEARLLTGFPR